MLEKPLIFQLFEQAMHPASGAAAAADPGLGSALGGLFGWPGTIATAVVDSGQALWARREIRRWIRAGSVSPFGRRSIEAGLLDLAGVCLVQALVVSDNGADTGTRQLRHLAKGISAAFAGHDGSTGLAGAVSAIDASHREHMATTLLPLYRNFVLSGISDLRASGRLSERRAMTARSRYARPTIREVAAIPVPATHRLHDRRVLGRMVTHGPWLDGFANQPEPRPDWGPIMVARLKAGTFDDLLGPESS